ncbi:1-acyl-sn-glycerol-3-phosphate acyltransferase [Candidatus Saccharibacteria bacterium]|nr:1-acyl-sn-glycerol-3-phosphate acyltransferase [Candidatus Saccharibacteria bacterium]
MKTLYYRDFSDNFVETKNQTKSVPENYHFIKKNPVLKLAGAVLFLILKLVAAIYGKFWLGLKIEGKDKLRTYVKSTKKGYYLYANHTLTLGDVFNPALYNPIHPYYVCDSSNLGIPILGPILPLVGALPIPDSIRGKKRLFDAISTRAKQGKAIVIYPEAHLWPYYTGIRPFDSTAFSFPVRDDLPVFTATTTFHAWKGHKKPRITIFIDGPFYAKTDTLANSIPTSSLSERALQKVKASSLHDQALSALKKRAASSTIKYIDYKKREEN